jgi:hypothetical protein
MDAAGNALYLASNQLAVAHKLDGGGGALADRWTRLERGKEGPGGLEPC